MSRIGVRQTALALVWLMGVAVGITAEAQKLGDRTVTEFEAAPLGFRSQTAPVTEVGIAPSAKQLADKAVEASFGHAETPLAAKILGQPRAALPGRPMRVGSVFGSGAAAAAPAWESLRDGQVTQFRVSSRGAKGIRARIELPAGVSLGEIRVRSADDVQVQSVPLSAQFVGSIWTPYTNGDVQWVEVYSPQRVQGAPMRVADIVHFEQSIDLAGGGGAASVSTAAGACSPDVACTSGDATLDAAIAERRKSVARMSFQSGSGSFLCSGTLINSASQQNFFMTANHCISTAAEAASITFRWFYEAATCGGSAANLVPESTSTSGGAQLVFTNQFVDSTLLRLNVNPPAAAVFADWNASAIAPGTPVVSISHPTGDVKKYATGTLRSLFRTNDDGLIRVSGYEQEMWAVYFTRGVIEGGSSGSGLYTLNNGSLIFRGVLSNSTVRNASGGLSCTNTNENANYGRWEYFQPQVAGILNGGSTPTDDHANQPGSSATPLVLNGAAVAGKIDYVGDLDAFRINVTETGTLYVRSTGGYDLIGQLMNSAGTVLEDASGDAATNDDASTTGLDFGIAWPVTPGTYYLMVANWNPAELTPNGYTVTANFVNATNNYTALWWAGDAESGWGMNLNHQSNTIFATMFNYENAGLGTQNPAMWLAASLTRQGTTDTYTGRIARANGPGFNADPFPNQQLTITDVGSMTIAFAGANNGTLTYSVSGAGTGGAGTPVVKSIVKQSFGTLPACTFTGSDRTVPTGNFQDLWWNANESGWGINLTHQSDTIFATLFTYEPGAGNNNKGLWLTASMPRLTGATYSGDLAKVTGSAFNAVPFTPINPAVNATRVGNMRVQFTGGNAATLTYDVNGVQVVKTIERQLFGPLPVNLPTTCSPP